MTIIGYTCKNLFWKIDGYIYWTRSLAHGNDGLVYGYTEKFLNPYIVANNKLLLPTKH
jgi:hypothetical protein